MSFNEIEQLIRDTIQRHPAAAPVLGNLTLHVP
jgi:hypothetical protein